MIFLHQIDPIAFSLGPLSVHWYGIMYLLGFLAAWWLGRQRIRAGRLPGVDEQGFGDLLFYGMLGVVLGGRIGYVLFYAFGELIRDPLMLFRIWEGGMSFHGGLVGVMVAALLWARRHKLHFFDVADFIVPLVPPGLGFGRLGNYIGGELWGKTTGGDWGVVFPGALPQQYAYLPLEELRSLHASGALDTFARHPSQLYQACLEGLVMFVVLWWFSSRPRPRYAVAGLFALLYGCFRFLVEFVRVPDEQLGYLAFDWLTMGQVLSLPLIALGLFWLWLSRRSPTLQPQPATTKE
ncbi:prolipoprotein diacylglyceryl transferase [Marilutibacter alkalisoli]|uniref:Phosphatidylglycerol--prolipoprotein diacylglyceryl transferase n=1 Tax=Marilutibacter alkalisoli TaxID=2591633 RepID=A0A514BTU0_9GAMM|nr:prolipoprotein diacylglyceryl transferase [Lysobacter alkalisoli]QDH70790.1 prolipoprotein diacylglyceryl transferase [Lysobacter alkalisoli]